MKLKSVDCRYKSGSFSWLLKLSKYIIVCEKGNGPKMVPQGDFISRMEENIPITQKSGKLGEVTIGEHLEKLGCQNEWLFS